MKLVSRILIFSLCILFVSLGKTQTSQVESSNKQLTPPSAEKLDNTYVQILISNENSVTVSILQSFQKLTSSIQEKYYSLLNWQTQNRSSDLEIDNYDRKRHFGRWINDPNDDVCFNTRAKVLVRDSIQKVIFKDTNHCVVDKGDWLDPYTRTNITGATEMQIDHLVPLKNAYLSGAYNWSFKLRCLYANYLGEDFHLISADGIQNMKKGDKAPDKYIPPNPDYTCTYIRNWLAVKMLWNLTMTTSESTAIAKLISDNHCDLAQFRMSEQELNTQRQFAQDNIDLCEKIIN